jgi:hypothetical protein
LDLQLVKTRGRVSWSTHEGNYKLTTEAEKGQFFKEDKLGSFSKYESIADQKS